ncbi:hypothetical protein GCM10007147_45840 [Nocardiopsis kunsanensis]|uniref:Uncharacterized protein n=1 Tax=Nocardiopsis kunsanensis TaxID=141693 RepID=A0A918XMB4_9ACTN|nr:hypothetical protein [Nocardiopsis kunsanensis]GHD37661.1 hypothetical protein GCM10007147_45840 [Nocardiopsis kunsanensis]
MSYSTDPTPDMLNELRTDGTPAHYRVHADDLRTLNAPSSCPVAGCALLAGHTGLHMTLEAEEFADVSTQNDVSALVREVSAVLVTPGTLRDACEKLNAADAAFGRLDMELRRGGRVPACWSPIDDDMVDVLAWEPDDVVTRLYDTVSAALRTTGDASTCLGALREACKAWAWFDAALCAGSDLPEPWQK